ncbi:hypothetical protein AAFN75_14760 [Algibacter sp. AS12]|uniref:hypothetical protein n=1 Tax=Algibacter sp. AS12 TaxID=3135773 RepID=UPI00398A8AE6
MKNLIIILLLSITSIKLCSQNILNLESKREIFIDDHLIDSISGLELKLNHPREIKSKNIPNGYYQTIIKTDSLYRIYFRDKLNFWKGKGFDGNPGEITKSATSIDGYSWKEENTFLNDSIKNYIHYEPPFNHNFTPFKDLNPKSKYKYRAIAGTINSGLFSFYSNDGIKFKRKKEAILKVDTTYYEFDSQNLAFWSEKEEQYVIYFRRFINGLRSFARTTSKDFVNWSTPINIFPNLNGEHLYTSGVQPYFRAPHFYISLATRFFPENGNSTDIVIMSSRDGLKFNRQFKEAFIRPGMDQKKWGNRSNYITLNVVPLDDKYMGIFARNSLYKIRLDGFSSINARFNKGFFITKPFQFKGDQLEINYSTSAGGYIIIEILDGNNNPIDNFTSYISDKMIGDEISRIVPWKKNTNISSLIGNTIKLRITMKEADLYSLKFTY